ALRDANGAIRALLLGDPSAEREISSRSPSAFVEVERQSVIDRALPVQMRQRPALRVRDRRNRHPGKLVIELFELRNIEPPVKRRQIRLAVASRQRKMKVVDMEVHDVEFVHSCEYPLEHHEVA